MAPLSVAVAALDLVRSQGRQTAEHEFAAWYHVPAGKELRHADGWWFVEDEGDGQAAAGPHPGRPPQSS
jgi:hypothetical protein